MSWIKKWGLKKKMFDLDKDVSKRFQLKLGSLQSDKTIDRVEYLTCWIYDQSDPETITGSVTCPTKSYRKITFNDGFYFLYKIINNKPFFTNFGRFDLN